MRHGSEQQRGFMIDRVIENTQNLNALFDGKYSHYLFPKITKYGSRKHKDIILHAILPQIKILIKGTYSSEVVENLYYNSIAKNKTRMLKSLFFQDLNIIKVKHLSAFSIFRIRI